MKTEHVIYFSSAGCELWSWHQTRFIANPVRIGAGTDSGPLAAELRRLEPGPIAVLVDMIDEEHVRDTVPRLGHRDQRAILERKLGRAYPRTVFRTALMQGRNAENPDENRVLLSALTRPEPVSALLATLADAKLPVAGVFSPALLTAQLLDAPARAAAAVLLVLRRSNGRAQHSFFRHGALAGSRRLRARAGDETTLMYRQLEESLRYFDPTFSVSPETPLQVVLAPADAALLNSADRLAEGWQPRPLDVPHLCKRFRIAEQVVDSERLFIELLRAHAPAASFAPSRDTRYFELFHVRRYTKAACWVFATLAIAGTLRNALYIADARQQLANQTQAARQLQAVLPAPRAANTVGADPLEMRQVVSTYDELERHRSAPEKILTAIGAAVSLRPRIHVDAIQWRARADDAPIAAGGDVATVRGRVTPFNGDYPQAFGELAALKEALERDPTVQAVTTLVQPLDIRPSSTLNDELARDHSEAEAAFTLQIVMRVPHESV